MKNIRNACISVTELRRDTAQILEKLPSESEKIIFVNNKPRAALIDIALYEKLMERFELRELDYDALADNEKQKIKAAKSLPESAWVNL